MKKILFLMLVIGGGAMLVKGGHVTVTPDNQVKVVGWAVPLPESVQSSPVMGMVATIVRSQLPPEANAGDSRSASANPVRPAVPNINSANGTFNANAPAAARSPGGLPDGANQLSAVARSLR